MLANEKTTISCITSSVSLFVYRPGKKVAPLNNLWKTHLFASLPVFPLLLLFSSVAPGFEAMTDQNICNKIMVKLIQNYSGIFLTTRDGEGCAEEPSTLIIVKVSYTHRNTRCSCLYEIDQCCSSVQCTGKTRNCESHVLPMHF